jgi:hypothetical protein
MGQCAAIPEGVFEHLLLVGHLDHEANSGRTEGNRINLLALGLAPILRAGDRS